LLVDILLGHFVKQLLKPCGLDQPEAFLLPGPEFKNDHPTRSSVACFSGFFSFYIFRRTISPFELFGEQYLFRCRNDFHHFLTLCRARNNFGVIFSFVYTVFALFTFHVLVAYGGPRGYI